MVEIVDLSERRWRIRASRDVFDGIKHDEEFRAIVKLARAANAVLFCQLLLVEGGGDSPRSQRIRMNAFLYLSSVLYEAILLAKDLGKTLQNYPVFAAFFKPLFRDRRVEKYTERYLKSIRNQGVFHFTEDSIPDGLLGLERDEFDFVVAEGTTIADTYHILADEAVAHGGFGVDGSGEDIYEQLRPLIKEGADLSARFTTAAEHVIPEVLLAKGFSLRAPDLP